MPDPSTSPHRSTSVDDLKVMSFGEHLEELRSRIVRSLLITIFFALIALLFQAELMEAISAPHRRAMRQVQGRRLAEDVREKLAVLREEVAAIPLAEGAAAVAVEERLAVDIRRLQEEATTPFEEAVARFLLEDVEGAITGSGLSGRIDRIRIDLEAASEDHAWGAQGPIRDAREDLETVEGTVASWRIEAARLFASPGGSAATTDRARDTVRQLDRELETLASRSDRLHHWRDEQVPLRLLSYVEAFFSHLKLAFLCGVLFGLPWITYEMWLFIAAGLYKHERNAVAPFLPFSLVSLLAGGVFAYKILIPVGLSYLGGYGDPDVFEPTFTLSNYMGLVFTLLIGMGLVFQLPLVMIFLSRSGMVTPEKFREVRKYSIVGALVFGAFLTPPDVVTQLLMAGPLILLYETGIIASVWFRRRARKRETALEVAGIGASADGGGPGADAPEEAPAERGSGTGAGEDTR